MGPTTLFDKSFLHSLKLNEAVWFDHFTLAVISPIFYIETCSDLKKDKLTEDEATKLVKILAEKAPQVSGSPNVYHRDLCIASLTGSEIEMSGRVFVQGGNPVSDGESSGYVFDNFPELLAFERWKEGDFKEVEKVVAANWRGAVASFSMDFITKSLEDLGVDLSSCKSLDQAYQTANDIVSDKNKSFHLMVFLTKVLGINDLDLLQDIQAILINRANMGYPPLQEYALFYARLELFYYIAVKKGFMNLTHRADILYLAYLPFCFVFVSTDRSHKMAVKYFLREDQLFIDGSEMKKDLAKIHRYYKRKVSAADQVKGMMHFAPRPPLGGEFLIMEIWDKILGSNWRKGDPLPISPKKEKALIDDLKRRENAPVVPAKDVSFDTDTANFLMLKRSVSIKRGDWYQLPHDIDQKISDRS